MENIVEKTPEETVEEVNVNVNIYANLGRSPLKVASLPYRSLIALQERDVFSDP